MNSTVTTFYYRLSPLLKLKLHNTGLHHKVNCNGHKISILQRLSMKWFQNTMMWWLQRTYLSYCPNWWHISIS